MVTQITLSLQICDELDTVSAVLVGVAEANDLWPVSVNKFVEVFPYIDKRTCRYRWEKLAERGYCVRTQGRNESNQAVVLYERAS
jgi:hypothetical protein